MYVSPIPSFASGRYGLAVYVSVTCLKNSRAVSHFLALSASVPLSKRNLSGSVVPAGTLLRPRVAQAAAVTRAATTRATQRPSHERCLAARLGAWWIASLDATADCHHRLLGRSTITVFQPATDARPRDPLRVRRWG